MLAWHVDGRGGDTATTTYDEFAAAVVESLRVTPEARAAIAATPQRTPEWRAHRQLRLTASNFATAAGRCGKAKRAQLLAGMLWGDAAGGVSSFVARFMQYGTDNEPVARDVYVAHRRRTCRHATLFAAEETGLWVSLEHGWLAASPDLLVTEAVEDAVKGPVRVEPREEGENDVAMVATEVTTEATTEVATAEGVVPAATVAPTHDLCAEIKCPATGKLYSEHAKHSLTGGVPENYMDQMQGQMEITDRDACDFIVYTPWATEIRRVPRDRRHWTAGLLPDLCAFYFGEFLPRLWLKRQGKLAPGEIDPPAPRLRTIAPGNVFDVLMGRATATKSRKKASLPPRRDDGTVTQNMLDDLAGYAGVTEVVVTGTPDASPAVTQGMLDDLARCLSS